MQDREKVIKGLEAAESMLANINRGGRIAVMQAYACEKWVSDALALLKQQEVKQVNISQTHCGMKYGLCPRCEKQIDTLVNPHYCGNCGQELKWE